MALPKLLQKLFTNGGAGDKLNPDILPEMNYLPTSGGTVNGSVKINGTTVTSGGTVNGLVKINGITVTVPGSTETYQEGIRFGWGPEMTQSNPNGLDIWAKRGDATTVVALYGEKKDGDTTGNTPGLYFRAGDGKNTRSMKLSATKGLTADVCELRRSAGQKELKIKGSDNDGCIQIYPGSEGRFVCKKSASLYLSSTDYTGNSIGVGHFVLSAMDATTGQKSLIGAPDGSLTWCGRSLARGLTVVAESYSANSWYRKYSDGWIEQGGNFTARADRKNGSKNVALPIAFSSACYSVVALHEEASSSGYTSGDDSRQYTPTIWVSNVTKTNVVFTWSTYGGDGGNDYAAASLTASLYMCGK